MLVCRACNTRYDDSKAACPSCGRRSTRNATESKGDSGPLPPSTPLSEDPEIDLEEESVVERKGAIAPRPAASAPRAAAPPPRAHPAKGPVEAAAGSAKGRVEAAAGSAKGRVAASPDQVKALLGEQPGLLETGLGLHADEDGEPVGLDFATPVGSIDLLARDRKGGFLVVHIPAPDEVADSVSAMLRRMGWVRKHLVEGGADVRGVVVLDQLPEDLVYAAAGAGGSVSFKSCQLSLSFHDLDA